mgnify:CR=1 FL=1
MSETPKRDSGTAPNTGPNDAGASASTDELFDAPLDRTGTASTKWDRYAGRDVLPFWVADMEFRAPQPIIDALHARIDHGVFGYTVTPPSLNEAAIEFLHDRYGWQVDPAWLVWIPGVVPGFNLACRAVTQPGDAVMTATPIYYPFLAAPGNAGCTRIETPLMRETSAATAIGGAGEKTAERTAAKTAGKTAEETGERSRWVMDFDALEAAITDRTRLFMLCNPHNPTGRVYERGELETLAGIAERHDLVLCSDEIHAELVLDADRSHLPIASLDAGIAQRTITLIAPTKTFNIPGLSCACAVIPDPQLRRRFRHAGAGLLAGIGPLGFAAAEAAWRYGEPWRQRLLAVLRRNRDRLQAAVDGWPGMSMTHVEATCLAWIDARGTGIDDPQAFFEAAGVGLSPGPQFAGDHGAGVGFVRFNFGCQASMLEVGIERMDAALAARG